MAKNERRGQIMRLIALVGVFSTPVIGCGAVAQEDINSANYWLPFCQSAATGNHPQGNSPLVSYCAGLVDGLTTFAACPPKDVTPEQAIRVVVQYIGERPARMNENFKILAIEALRAAWPCRR
jgi:hypothetical protein